MSSRRSKRTRSLRNPRIQLMVRSTTQRILPRILPYSLLRFTIDGEFPSQHNSARRRVVVGAVGLHTTRLFDRMANLARDARHVGDQRHDLEHIAAVGAGNAN